MVMMSRSLVHHSLLAVSLALLACRAPTPVEEQATPVALPTLAPRALPLSLPAMLELAGEHTDYIVLRDAQALVDAGTPWEALLQRPTEGSEAAGYMVQLQKWVEGPDPPIKRAGVDLRGGVVLAESVPGQAVFMLASSDPTLTATLLTTLPYARSDKTVCRGLDAAPPHIICTTQETVPANYALGDGAARLATLQAGLPGIDLEAATLLASLHKPALELAVQIEVGRQTIHVHYPEEETLKVLDAALDPGPASLLRFVQPGVGFAWARIDMAALRLLWPNFAADVAPLEGVANAWTGELLLSGVAEPTGLQLRVGLSDTKPASGLIGLLALDALDRKITTPIDGMPGGVMVSEASKVSIGGETTPMLRAHVEGVPLLAAVSGALGLPARGSMFAAHESLAVMIGVDDPNSAALTPRADAEAALGELPPGAVADLRAGRAFMIVHASLDALQSPAMREALDTIADHVPADQRWKVREGLLDLAVISRLTVWGSEHEGKTLWHLVVEGIGHTVDAEGKAALAALYTKDHGGPAPAFAALAGDHPDSPRATAYQARAGVSGPAGLTRSLGGAITVLVMLLDGLTEEESPTDDAPID